MKIRIKAKSVEIEYEEPGEPTSYYFATGKGNSRDNQYDATDKHLECMQKLIDGVEQLLKA